MPDAPFVLGVDLDNVVADYTAGFAEFFAQERGIDPATLPPQERYNFESWGLEDSEYEKLHHRAVTDYRLLAKLSMIDNASEVLWRLSDAGVWIRVITHRLYVNWGHAEAVTDTVEWLDAHSIPYRDICFLGDKPEVEADCYVEDAPHNIDALREGGNDVIVYTQPYNSAYAEPQAQSWREVEYLVMARLTLWRGHSGVQQQFPGIDAGSGRLAHRRS